MSLRSWWGKTFSLRDKFPWGALFYGETWAGEPVSTENSIQLAAWWRCVKLYAEVTGALPLKFYERDNNDERKIARDHSIAVLIGSDPNAEQTTTEFWGSIGAGLAMLGNGYAEKKMIGARIVALEPMPYDTCPDRKRGGNKDGELEYRYVDRGKDEYLPAAKVFHVRGFTLGRADEGLSPLTAARQTLSISLATEKSSGQTFSKGLRMSGFFAGAKMDVTQRDEFQRSYIDPIKGNNATAHYGILPPGFEFKPVAINPKDAEMLLSRRYNVEEICRFLGVPPILVGHSGEGQTMWGTGIESIMDAWLTLGLNAFLTAIEKAINKRLLTPADRTRFYAEFDRNALLRIDTGKRAEFISKMIQNAQMTPNEGRKKENLPPMDGGDVLLINSTLVPLSQAGIRPARVQPAPGEPIPEPAL